MSVNSEELNYKHFKPEVSEKLGSYVYRLVDPRNGETFYVGKGISNRVFNHISEAIKTQHADLNEKTERIRDIHRAGFEVSCIIHRHGMTDDVAIEVEAALIDAYPGLSNIQTGEGSGGKGSMHANEIIANYCLEIAEISHKAILISINRGAIEHSSLYEAVRYSWRVSKDRAEKAELVLACFNGVIKDVFIPEKWLDATNENFPTRTDTPGRFGFIGEGAPKDIQDQYRNKRIPEDLKFGTGNPIRYANI